MLLLYGADLRFGKRPAAADRATADLKNGREFMTEKKRDYEVGHGKPPVGTRFKKGQSGNPGGRAKKNPPPLLVRKFDEQVVVATNGRRQKTTRREVVIVQLVTQPTGADLTKMLSDTLKGIEKQGLSTPL
jgi:Family of unknown function (DUF5681)